MGKVRVSTKFEVSCLIFWCSFLKKTKNLKNQKIDHFWFSDFLHFLCVKIDENRYGHCKIAKKCYSRVPGLQHKFLTQKIFFQNFSKFWGHFWALKIFFWNWQSSQFFSPWKTLPVCKISKLNHKTHTLIPTFDIYEGLKGAWGGKW